MLSRNHGSQEAMLEIRFASPRHNDYSFVMMTDSLSTFTDTCNFLPSDCARMADQFNHHRMHHIKDDSCTQHSGSPSV